MWPWIAIVAFAGAAGWFYYQSRSAAHEELTKLPRRPLFGIGQVPVIGQLTPWTCGPAALCAVLAHHGVNVSEVEASALTAQAPIIGSRPEGLAAAARELGFVARVEQLVNVGQLARLVNAGLPTIALVDSFTRPGKQGHYVVVTAADGGRVYMMDPHLGQHGGTRVLMVPEFDRRWWDKTDVGTRRRTAVVIVPEGNE
jgi:ABC-type bacteriocin/lantibiotic exporter with double-glycine peptidase domain